MSSRFVPLLLLFFSIDMTASPQTEWLRKADQLAWRGNWTKAGPLYVAPKRNSTQVVTPRTRRRRRLADSELRCKAPLAQNFPGSSTKLLVRQAT